MSRFWKKIVIFVISFEMLDTLADSNGLLLILTIPYKMPVHMIFLEVFLGLIQKLFLAVVKQI
jgi:hypothetical protein